MSKAKLPKGFKIEVEDRPDCCQMTSWTLYAVLFEWKTSTRKRFLRKPVTRTGWHFFHECAVGHAMISDTKMKRFIRASIQTIELRDAA